MDPVNVSCACAAEAVVAPMARIAARARPKLLSLLISTPFAINFPINMGSVVEVPPDWYRSGFPPKTAAMPWADRPEAEVDRAGVMLRPQGGERILDLACGIGRHSRELRRRGFEVVGVHLKPAL